MKLSFAAVRFAVFLFWSLGSAVQLRAQDLPVRTEAWNAVWIGGPPSPPPPAVTDPAIYDVTVWNFRKAFTVDTLPEHFLIHVSADNRYQLFINGRLVSLGPARGDLYHWNFETVDLAPYLRKGRNSLAAVVWNFGVLRPEAQISYRTAFILQGYSGKEERVNTDTSWKVLRDSSYRLIRNAVPGYYVAGPGERVEMAKKVRDWMEAPIKDSSWTAGRVVAAGHTRATAIDVAGWMLVPSTLPQMELRIETPMKLRKWEGTMPSTTFPGSALTIPAHSTARFLLDQGYLTNAYPTLSFSGGRGARIGLGYSESLYIPDSTAGLDTTKSSAARFRILGKGNRDSMQGKKFVGTKDSIFCDGSSHQQFTPLWWRTYRYILLSIATGDEPLTLDSLTALFTGYPFRQTAEFEADDPFWNQLRETGWRTARLCAMETYMDCPFYEQLQYAGDTRIQALISLFETGDDRLMRQAIDLLDQSRIAEGITLSRWPSSLHQQIPTFSLWYIGMLHDYFRYRPDTAFVRRHLPGVRQILSWFERYEGDDGLIRNPPFWNFTDWITAKGWQRGMAPKGKGGESAVIDLQLLWAYRQAAEMEDRLGIRGLAAFDRRKADCLEGTIQKKYWSPLKGLYADTGEKDVFSQHANALAILTGLVKGEKARLLAGRLEKDTALVTASLYYKYYVHGALVMGGLGEHYTEWLSDWKKNLKLGLTTWAEMPDVAASRSDCHAWGAHPNIEAFRTVLGIDSDAPFFQRVRIQPHPGSLRKISGRMPHPLGIIEADYRKTGAAWDFKLLLPKGLNGRFIWKGKEYRLKEGVNRFRL